MKVKVPVRPSEFFDRLTILVNKVYNCPKESDVTKSLIELMALIKETDYAPVKKDIFRVAEALRNLRDANKDLWNLEEMVRIVEGDNERLEISDQIREFNHKRWEYKHDIDEAFSSITETKDYSNGYKQEAEEALEKIKKEKKF